MALSSCPIFFRVPGVALLLLVVRLERHDFQMKRTDDSVSLAIGSNGSDRNLLISVMSKSVQNSSVRACTPSVPCGEKRMKSGRDRQIVVLRLNCGQFIEHCKPSILQRIQPSSILHFSRDIQVHSHW